MNSPKLAADEIFHAARAIGSPEKRLGYLDGACGNDSDLRSKVDALLAADADAGTFLAPAGDPDATIPNARPNRVDSGATERAGQVIGRYKLLQQIGEGGFGSVWMAEQREPVVRKVALKIIKLGMDTRQVIARFEAERQALALMDHPHIAKVLDAGATETGRPYFVMELCTGDEITEYCDKKNLTIPERLELFAQVCQAVQHAHQKALIHRDIKPSNVLVATQDGKPHAKVIDFGIAKATASRLTEKTLFTEHKQLVGTPHYMSPEQAEGSRDIDTRTDVYSLGVLLYELLTGTTPFSTEELRSAAFAEMQRIIREVEPPRPSTRLSQNTDTLASVAARRHIDPRKLGTIIRGELDWIVMKCLEKDRQRRYETANGLAMDIRRFLEGDAVIAAPPSAVYRFRKFVRRNKGVVTAGSMVALALVLGMAGTAWQAKLAADRAEAARTAEAEAKLARDAEKARADELKQVSDFQAKMLSEIDTTKAGVDFVADVRERFAAALEKAAVPEAERTSRSQAFRAELMRVNATDTAAAMIDRTILRPAVKAIDEQFKNQPVVDAQLRQTLAVLYDKIGLYDAAYPLMTLALETRRRTLGEQHPDTLTSINNTGFLLQAQGRLAEAEPYWREALEKHRRVLGEEHPHTLGSINNMGCLLNAHGKLAEAEAYYREALEKRRRVLGMEHPETLRTLGNLGSCLREQHKPDQAFAIQRELFGIQRRTTPAGSAALSGSLAAYGSALLQRGTLDAAKEAEPILRECLEIRVKVMPDDWRVANTKSLLGNAILAIADLDSGLSTDARVQRLREAEPPLLDGYNGLKDNPAVPTPVQAGGDRKREALERVARLYEVWDMTAPGKGHDAKAAEWQSKLQALRSATQPAPKE